MLYYYFWELNTGRDNRSWIILPPVANLVVIEWVGRKPYLKLFCSLVPQGEFSCLWNYQLHGLWTAGYSCISFSQWYTTKTTETSIGHQWNARMFLFYWEAEVTGNVKIKQINVETFTYTGSKSLKTTWWKSLRRQVSIRVNVNKFIFPSFFLKKKGIYL